MSPWLLQLGLIAVAFARTMRTGRLPVFAAFLAFDFALVAVAIAASDSTKQDVLVSVWAWGQIVTAAFWVACFIEIRAHVLSRYPGIGRVATWVTGVALAIGFALIAATATENRSGIMRFAVFLPRLTAAVLFVSMALIGWFMRRYPSEHPGNVRRHMLLFWIYLGGRAVSLWGSLYFEDAVAWPMVGTFVSATCFLSWSLAMRREAETPFVPTATIEELRAAQLRSDRALDLMRDA